MVSRFIQIHTLHSYTGVLLNRDDTGLAKRIPLGGHVRTRISSQCLKRHWRTAGGEGFSLVELGEKSVRTRHVERRIEPMLTERNPGMTAEVKAAALEGVVQMLYGDGNTETKKRQALLLGESELVYLVTVAEKLADGASSAKHVKDRIKPFVDDNKTNWKAMKDAVKLPGGIPAALFGRMVTADPASNIDAAVSVAHSFTVHAQESEGDALTVVDDLNVAGEAGAGGMFDTEINSGVFYGYTVIDVPQLVANLCGTTQEKYADPDLDRELAAMVTERLVKLVATVTPGAKLGSTAPFGHVEAMMIEVGDAQPRSLSGAFHVPVGLRGNRSVVQTACDRVVERIAATDQFFGGRIGRMQASVVEGADLVGAKAETLDRIAAFAGDAVRGQRLATAA